MRGERACDFADVPFDRMQPITAVGNMGRTNVFARGQQVLDALGNQRAERNLKGQRSYVKVIVASY